MMIGVVHIKYLHIKMTECKAYKINEASSLQISDSLRTSKKLLKSDDCKANSKFCDKYLKNEKVVAYPIHSLVWRTSIV